MSSVYWLVPFPHVSDTLSDLNSVCLKTGVFSALLGECRAFRHKLEASFVYNCIFVLKYEGNSISKLQTQVATYIFELSAGNYNR
jgi:hypothetical protein